MNVSRKGIVICALPNAMMLVLFYSLAVHMYWSLGGWPISIGERGFPPALIVHGQIAMYYFIALLLFGIFVWPFVTLICLASRDFRPALPYVALYALSFLVCWGLMQLAPEPFLYWWRD